ncbi:hypothetical protein GVAV_001880 [Gurleya vavrai]
MSSDYISKITDALNKQLNLELTSFYLYRASSSFCQNPKISFPGLKKYFRKQEKEELSHAQGVIQHLNIHGWEIKYDPINIDFKPKGMQCLLEMALKNEENERENILECYKIANENKDFDTCLFLDAYVSDSARSTSEAREMILKYERFDKKMGEVLFDHFFEHCDKKK